MRVSANRTQNKVAKIGYFYHKREKTRIIFINWPQFFSPARRALWC